MDVDKGENRKKRWGAAVGMFASLQVSFSFFSFCSCSCYYCCYYSCYGKDFHTPSQDTLMGAMEERRTALDEDSDEDDELEDEWSDSDDDWE